MPARFKCLSGSVDAVVLKLLMQITMFPTWLFHFRSSVVVKPNTFTDLSILRNTSHLYLYDSSLRGFYVKFILSSLHLDGFSCNLVSFNQSAISFIVL